MGKKITFLTCHLNNQSSIGQIGVVGNVKGHSFWLRRKTVVN